MAEFIKFCCTTLILVSISTINAESLKDFTNGEIHSTNLPYFDLTNHHHRHFEEKSSPKLLRFSIHGTNVSEIKYKSEFNFTVQLGDQTLIEIDKLDDGQIGNLTEYRIVWKGAGPSLDREICFHYGRNNASWYSTYEEMHQHWPLDTNQTIVKGKSFTTADFVQLPWVGNIVEYLFINSDGFGVMLNEHSPWFIRRDPNQGDPILCFSVSNEPPYQKRAKHDNFDMIFHIKTARNIKSLWKSYINTGESAQPMKLSIPKGIPDKKIFTYPIWSTWARYHRNVTEDKVLGFAKEILENNFTHAQLEIDDRWEVNYGDLTFDPEKFPDAKKMIAQLHEKGFRVTIWTYPFINNNSIEWELNKKHFQKDEEGNPLVIKWWTGWGSPIDFTDPENVVWFVNRLERFKNETGIDSFKFDAGEVNWYGRDYSVHNPLAQQYPNLLTTAYVEACAKLGGMIEVRAAFKSQHLPVFVRMMDKGSFWTWNGGIRTLIPTALTMSIAGYSFNLPDMIGGNGKPTEELLYRWIQANAFLPSMQFSVPPWSFGENFTKIAFKYVKLHEEHAQTFIELAEESTKTGEPIIRPMWFAEPEDERSFRIWDQFMVGENIVVAPVVEPNTFERKVFLPSGTWIDQNGKEFLGPVEIHVQVPIEKLPYFKRKF